ncbi:DegT/DnrJ/EryC1/StrS family aminotransferase [Rubripirellula sp.]|nr:DegT/DnrJ/EryC1/StrS family aminotransferase [Rubripirellula sp.]
MAKESNPSSFIPRFDYRRGLSLVRSEINDALARVLDSGQLILGPEVAAFEKEFATFLKTDHAIGVASGTDAITLALRSIGVERGDEVITSANGCSPTVAAILATGAKPVFVDVMSDTLQIDSREVKAAISEKTRAIVCVHLHGAPAEITALLEIARELGLFVIEDCAQAFGAKHGSGFLGTFGHVGCFSFYPTKPLGAFGDGGMCITRDASLANAIRSDRTYGYQGEPVSKSVGCNSRLDEMQAAVLRVKLKRAAGDLVRRDCIAKQYQSQLAGSGLRLPVVSPNNQHAWHQYVVRTNNRDALQRFLRKSQIETGIHYAIPLHQMPAYRQYAPLQSLPVTERSCGESLSLPMFSELTTAEVDRVIAVLCDGLTKEGNGLR